MSIAMSISRLTFESMFALHIPSSLPRYRGDLIGTPYIFAYALYANPEA